jgi:hypothetical protein
VTWRGGMKDENMCEPSSLGGIRSLHHMTLRKVQVAT